MIKLQGKCAKPTSTSFSTNLRDQSIAGQPTCISDNCGMQDLGLNEQEGCHLRKGQHPSLVALDEGARISVQH